MMEEDVWFGTVGNDIWVADEKRNFHEFDYDLSGMRWVGKGAY